MGLSDSARPAGLRRGCSGESFCWQGNGLSPKAVHLHICNGTVDPWHFRGSTGPESDRILSALQLWEGYDTKERPACTNETLIWLKPHLCPKFAFFLLNVYNHLREKQRKIKLKAGINMYLSLLQLNLVKLSFLAWHEGSKNGKRGRITATEM